MAQLTDLLAVRPETILLKGKFQRRTDEHQAASAITPGMLIEVTSANRVQPHSTRGGRSERRFAMENPWVGGGAPGQPWTGGTVDDAYATDDIVREHIAIPTDCIWALLHVGETVVKEDALISYGDGTLAKAAASFLADNTAPSNAVTNTTTETTFSNGSVTIPANTLKAGDVIRFHALVDVPSGNSTDTLTVKVKLGSTVVLTVPAFDPTNGGGDTVLIDGYLRVRTVGATGTVIAEGTYTAGVPGTATTRSFELQSTTVDTTAAQTLTVTATWSVANAADQAVLAALTVERISAGVTSTAPNGAGAVVCFADESVDLSAASANGRIRTRVL